MIQSGDAGLFDYDAELHLHNERFRVAVDARPHDQVLDIGCGTGQSTREAACAAAAGSALGVDVSTEMLDRARRLSDDHGLRNVTFQQADAQVYRFRPAHFDLCISRFGTMFFTDPAGTEGILAAAGFVDINFTDVHEPVYYGLDSATAYHTVLRLQEPRDLLANLDAATAKRAREQLRAALTAHETGSGVYFDSRAWIITARRQREDPA